MTALGQNPEYFEPSTDGNNDVYGPSTTSERTVRFRFDRFRSGNFDLIDQPRGRPETIGNNDKLKAIVVADSFEITLKFSNVVAFNLLHASPETNYIEEHGVPFFKIVTNNSLAKKYFSIFPYATWNNDTYNVEAVELWWPEEYSCEATKLYLDSGLVEDFKIWRTSKKSRIDYNKGAVKSIIVPSKSRRSYGLKYAIHPETTNYELNSMMCEITKGTREDHQEIETILPSTDYQFESQGENNVYINRYPILEDVKIIPKNQASSFIRNKVTGLERINDRLCCKYYAVTSDDEDETRMTIWAAFSGDLNGTIPIRYEEKKFNEKRGYLDHHYIWDFYNYNSEFNDTVFDTSNYDCTYTTKTQSGSKGQAFIDPEKDKHVNEAFNAFKTKYDKKYAHEREHSMRRNIFQKNLRLITSTNRQNLGYKLTINEFADRTPEEMTRHKGLLRVKKRTPGNFPFPYDVAKLKELSDTLPSEYDTRLFGLVNPIKNQQSCGSCWTFGTTAAVEGAYARKNGGRLLTLSNQALIDCAWGYSNFGCNGGSDTGAYQWMMDYGLPTEEDYGTYANQDGFCLIENMTTTYPILGFTDITPNSINALKVALINHGPVSTSIDASGAFSFYSGGVFYDITCEENNLNHEVTIVGYGEENGETFWILRNSWGPNWGIDGYMHISARNNNCGILTEPTYVVV
ncbi:cathepsin L like protein [Aphomia sociella]